MTARLSDPLDALTAHALRLAACGGRARAVELLRRGAAASRDRAGVAAGLLHLADLILAPESHAPDGGLRGFGGGEARA